eukprot:TRINITY_DN1179_c0_g1_i1.p2 TRINITY_DN1179_c0_g1~~TRINITY_DN1179_c0_g1_i1.p2  ORF type:complete len:137 (+),score=47.53 TRINITY_DN1179_c0_g1_i1:150-560(+)
MIYEPSLLLYRSVPPIPLKMVQRVHMPFKHKFPTGGHGSHFTIGKIVGGKLAVKRLKKRVAGPHAPKYLGHQRLQGTKALREGGRRGSYKAPKRHKTVSRAYGGLLMGGHLRDRIVRAFLIEEQKIVKAVMKKRKH